MKKICVRKAIYTSLLLLLAVSSWADTVYMTNGDVYEGTIKEIYADHIVIKEVSGQLNILKSKIKKIVYDKEEKNLLAFGDKYFRKDRFQEALEYYEKALNLNPTSMDVKDAILKVRGVIFHKKENLQSKRLNQRKNIQDWGENLGKHYVEEGFPAVEELEVKEEFGFVIEKKEGDIRIIDISPSSAAAAVHIFPGDILYAVNAQKVKFKSLDTIHRMILDTLIGDCRVTIERKVVILRDSIYFFQSPFSYIDAKVKKGNKSFFVTEVKEEGRAHLAGLRKNDRIVYVEGEPSSFMTLDSFQKKLMGVKGSRLVLVVRRDLQLIRREIS